MTENLETTITTIAARCLRLDHAVDAGTSFELLGLDSLASIELAAALEAELGCDLPPDVLAGCTDARSLAARLRRDGLTRRAVDDPFEQMLADAVLPDDVQPAVAGVARSTDVREARSILLTGATGFLGGALLSTLLESTTATLYCLVRPVAGRMHRSPADLGHGRLHPAHLARVRIVEGDLTHPRLGLSQARYDALAREIDAICHCGAAVNWVFAYPGLRAANVVGTLELLRLACRASASFHFVSSLSACYSTEGPRTADETFDALPCLRGVQLGYAQTKIVAEALVREAGNRGLPVRIYRPALISGNSVSGAFNRDDLIATLVRGCVEMGTAPDLDWKLDCEPVDSVAAAIVALSAAPGPVFHLGHEQPRHWRECVLWMRIYGYEVKLVSYPAWLRQLERDTRNGAPGSAGHPLRPLRSFFLERPAGGRGLTLPELYEEQRRTHATSGHTRAALAAFGVGSPPLDAALLDTYFRAFRREGELPDPPAAGRAQDSRNDSTDMLQLDAKFFSETLGTRVTDVQILGSGSDHSIVSELTAWRSKRITGLFRARLTNSAVPPDSRNVIVKVKAHHRDVIAVGEALADLIDPAVGREYRRYSDRIGFTASHQREIEIYRQRDDRFLRHSPALLGSVSEECSQTWLAVLEHVDDAVLADEGAAGRWQPRHIGRAIDGLAALQAIWFDREETLRAQPWIGHVQSAAGVLEMSSLWRALADHAAPFFSSWAEPDINAIHRHLISSVDRWWKALEEGPRTLIHNDFNPRNICLRGPDARLCAYDWELATIGAPQRDLAELLCFVLPQDASREEVTAWVERHRICLEREAGVRIEQDTWHDGFRSGLYDLLINRLAIYTMVHRVRRQSFLPRILSTWRNLYHLFPLERAS